MLSEPSDGPARAHRRPRLCLFPACISPHPPPHPTHPTVASLPVLCLCFCLCPLPPCPRPAPLCPRPAPPCPRPLAARSRLVRPNSAMRFPHVMAAARRTRACAAHSLQSVSAHVATGTRLTCACFVHERLGRPVADTRVGRCVYVPTAGCKSHPRTHGGAGLPFGDSDTAHLGPAVGPAAL